MAEQLILIPGLVAVVVVSLRLSLIDWREHRLPNDLVRPLAAGVTVWVLVLGVVTGDMGRSLAALLWAAAVFALFFLLVLAGGMGGGDAKFAFPLVATLGWFGADSIELAFLGLVVSAGLVGLVVIVQGKGKSHRVAYGPYMTLGLLCGIAGGILG